MTSHQGQSINNRRGTHGPPVPQIWCNSDYYLQSFIYRYRKMQSLCQGKGQRSHKAKNRRKHFRGEIGRAISNLVAVLVSDLWDMAGKMAQFFSTIGRHLECAIQTDRRGAQGPPVHQIWCNSDHYFRSYGILKKMAHAIFFRSAAILKVLVRPNWFSNLSEP